MAITEIVYMALCTDIIIRMYPSKASINKMFPFPLFFLFWRTLPSVFVPDNKSEINNDYFRYNIIALVYNNILDAIAFLQLLESDATSKIFI